MIDPDAVRRHGIRAVRGKHLTLYTDLPEGPAVDELPEVFDQAVPQWCDYLGIAPDRIAAWHVRAFLIGDKVRFTAAKLIPESLPEFLNGFAYQTELWLNEQKSDYYRRHLLLHEGTHALMNSAKGRAGAPWYMEGTAELLATHRWANGRLQLRRMPASRDEVPLWGRIKIVKDEYAANRGMTVEEILGYDHRAHLRNEPYGWCWALCAFLDGHPEYKSAFRSLYKESDRLDADFNQVAVERFKGDWNGLREQWRLFVAGLEYGHDIAKTTVDFTPGKPLAADGTSIPVAADRGWQNTGWRLEKGMEYRLNAAGRYVIARTDRAWWCEPAGVTIRYYQGRPLGQLLAAVRPDDHDPAKTSPLAVPTAVGLSATLVPEKSGTLFLRVNDSAGQLHDNEGSLDVLVTPSN
jgi:hypothetical protein